MQVRPAVCADISDVQRLKWFPQKLPFIQARRFDTSGWFEPVLRPPNEIIGRLAALPFPVRLTSNLGRRCSSERLHLIPQFVESRLERFRAVVLDRDIEAMTLPVVVYTFGNRRGHIRLLP